ncbi:hypothetical protein MXD81_21380, partial [Microbacteriaceae bacterium K1510]|nr:hypothetical protein [Microbacteriaceae bacterium K1510]
DTALICHALQTAGHASASPEIEKANRYLLSRQQHQYGDWALNNPGVLPGCWGFSNINTRNPDVDDTTAALRAIKRMAETDEAFGQAWRL